MIDGVYAELNSNFDNAFVALKRELARVRTGRANVNLLDGVRVSYYGQPTPINQVASLQIPEPRMIMIKPWDLSALKDIERALLQSDLGLNPSSDGNLIRLQIPALTEERRKELVRKVHKLGEEAKISVRNNRRDANGLLKNLQRDADISEDDMNRALKKVQDHTDEAVKKVDAIIAEKESELLEI